MEHESLEKSIDDALKLMEKTSCSAEQPWDGWEDLSCKQACRDLMDVRFALHRAADSEQIDTEKALAEFKSKHACGEKPKRFLPHAKKLFSGVAAAIAIGIVFAVFYSRACQKEILVYAADSTAQHIVLSSSDGRENILDTPASVPSAEKENVLDYTLPPASAKQNVKRTLLQTCSISIPRGKTFRIVLADGTTVWLNAKSKLIYPTAFVEDTRTVYLQGEAYFKVAKGEKPFIVKTDFLHTEVFGTEFNVRSYTPQDSRVTLITGKVKVTDSSNNATVDLTPGTAVGLCADGSLELQTVDADALTYWKDGYFYFDQLPLSDIMRSIGSWYNVNVVFRNEEALDYRIHFMAVREDDLSNIIRLMNRLKKVTLTLSDGTLYVD